MIFSKSPFGILLNNHYMQQIFNNKISLKQKWMWNSKKRLESEFKMEGIPQK